MHHEYLVLRKGALVRIMTHVREFLWDKIKCEVADNGAWYLM